MDPKRRTDLIRHYYATIIVQLENWIRLLFMIGMKVSPLALS